MIIFCYLLGFYRLVSAAETFFDVASERKVSDKEFIEYVNANTTFWCLNPVNLPCDPNEGRRIDGSCYNLKNPIKGMPKQKFYRVLPPTFGPGWYKPRLAKDGQELPLGRVLRTHLLAEGTVPDVKFTHNLANYLVFSVTDIASIHDSVNFVIWDTKCCKPEGINDPICAPNTIPDDDPVFRFSGNKCMNMTRPLTYQTQGCVNNNTTPERITTSTPAFDLSSIYGSTLELSNEKGRSFKGGLLKYETDDYGRIWPPTTQEPSFCLLNQRPRENKCFVAPDEIMNSIAGLGIVAIWFWRQHNGIATKLANWNPHWDDEKLFKKARDINIAINMQITLYEMFPLFVGYENLLNANVISADAGFRDMYKNGAYPQVLMEYLAAMRWVHTLQEGTIKLVNSTTGDEYLQMPLVNLTLRPGFMMNDRNIEGMTQGFFRQSGASADYVVDRDIASLGLGGMQDALDLCTNDLMKHRYFGFQPYVNYLKHYRHKSYTCFDDLLDVIDEERVEALKMNYNHVEDIDLLAGIWLEKHVEGGHVPITFFNILATQWRMTLSSDRHWYERPNRPNAFTLAQLSEIRKASLALMMCEYGDSVTEIQAQAFLKISPENPLVSCDDIVHMDFSPWKEPEC